MADTAGTSGAESSAWLVDTTDTAGTSGTVGVARGSGTVGLLRGTVGLLTVGLLTVGLLTVSLLTVGLLTVGLLLRGSVGLLLRGTVGTGSGLAVTGVATDTSTETGEVATEGLLLFLLGLLEARSTLAEEANRAS